MQHDDNTLSMESEYNKDENIHIGNSKYVIQQSNKPQQIQGDNVPDNQNLNKLYHKIGYIYEEKILSTYLLLKNVMAHLCYFIHNCPILKLCQQDSQVMFLGYPDYT